MNRLFENDVCPPPKKTFLMEVMPSEVFNKMQKNKKWQVYQEFLKEKKIKLSKSNMLESILRFLQICFPKVETVVASQVNIEGIKIGHHIDLSI